MQTIFCKQTGFDFILLTEYSLHILQVCLRNRLFIFLVYSFILIKSISHYYLISNLFFVISHNSWLIFPFFKHTHESCLQDSSACGESLQRHNSSLPQCDPARELFMLQKHYEVISHEKNPLIIDSPIITEDFSFFYCVDSRSITW